MGCSSSSERNINVELFYAIDNREYDKVQSLLAEGGDINAIYITTSKKNDKRNLSVLGYALTNACEKRGFRDLELLLNRNDVNLANDGTYKAIHKLYLQKKARLLTTVFQRGFGFHHNNFLVNMEYGINPYMMRFMEASLCPFVAKIKEGMENVHSAESDVWVTLYRKYGDEEDGVPRATLLIFRTGVTSLECKSAHCKVINASISKIEAIENSTYSKCYILGNEYWERHPNSVSPNLELSKSRNFVILHIPNNCIQWFTEAMNQKIVINEEFRKSWKPIYKRLNADIPNEHSTLLDKFIQDAIHNDTIIRY